MSNIKADLNRNYELNDDELKNVSGGGRRERKIIVVVYLPLSILNPYEMSVYEDGLYQGHLSGKIDPSVASINLPFVGSAGLSIVDVRLNNVLYKSYQVDFESGSYKEL